MANENYGLDRLRFLSRDAFETIYENPFGLISAELTSTSYAVWGATRDNFGKTVLQVRVDSDEVAESVFLGANGGELEAGISRDYSELLTELFSIFYDFENEGDFTSASLLSKEIAKLANLPWITPDIIIIHIGFTVNGEKKRLVAMENNEEWTRSDYVSASDVDPEAYLLHCQNRFAEFDEKISKEFDSEGNFIGTLGKVMNKEYKPKN